MPEVLSVKEGDEKYCGCPVLDPVVTAKLLPTTPTTLLVRVRVEPLAVAVTGELAMLLNTWANALATSVAVLLLLCPYLTEAVKFCTVTQAAPKSYTVGPGTASCPPLTGDCT